MEDNLRRLPRVVCPIDRYVDTSDAGIVKPKTLREAVEGRESVEWVKAMEEELKAMKDEGLRGIPGFIVISIVIC